MVGAVARRLLLDGPARWGAGACCGRPTRVVPIASGPSWGATGGAIGTVLLGWGLARAVDEMIQVLRFVQ
jgi:hypothetical protein